MSDQAFTEILREKIVLWQDYTHPVGYRPCLELIVFPDGKRVLRLNVFGHVTTLPFVYAEDE